MRLISPPSVQVCRAWLTYAGDVDLHLRLQGLPAGVGVDWQHRHHQAHLGLRSKEEVKRPQGDGHARM